MKHQLYLKNMTDRQTVVIQTWVMADIFLKMNEVSLSLRGKWTDSILPMIKPKLSSTNYNFREVVSMSLKLPKI